MYETMILTSESRMPIVSAPAIDGIYEMTDAIPRRPLCEGLRPRTRRDRRSPRVGETFGRRCRRGRRPSPIAPDSRSVISSPHVAAGPHFSAFFATFTSCFLLFFRLSAGFLLYLFWPKARVLIQRRLLSKKVR